jgi:hypothetical protein
MPLAASQSFIDESANWQNGHPDFRIQIIHDGTTYEETRRVLNSSTIDRILEKWDSFGLALAAQVTLTLANHDQRYNPANTSSPFYPDTLIGATVKIFIKFYTILTGTYASQNIHASQNLYITQPQTEEILEFTGVIKSISGNGTAEASIVIRDAVQDLLDKTYVSADSYSGDPATVIKEIVEDAGLEVDNDQFLLTQDKVKTITCALDTEIGQTYLDAIQEVTVATGLAVFTDEQNDVVIFSIYPNFNDFDQFGEDQSGILLYTGDHTDRDNFNIMNIDGGIEESAVRNKVILTYKDLTTGDETTTIRTDADSIAKYGEKTLSISTNLQMDKFSADVWPARLISRYRDPRREYRAGTSLKSLAINRVGEYVRLTEPNLSESESLFMMRKKGLDIKSNRGDVSLQDITDLDEVKWAFVGSEIVESDSNRISGIMDYLHNKGFESAKNPGVDDRPEKWAVISETGDQAIAISTDQAFSGLNSCKVSGAGTGGGVWEQIINLNPLADSTQYTIAMQVRGVVSSGSVSIRIFDNLSVQVGGTLFITSGITDSWAQKTLTFTTNTDDPFTVQINSSLLDGTVYVDEMQIDAGASPKPYQVNWKSFAFAGHDTLQANPGFDLDGNVNGVINGIAFLEGFEELHKVAS